MMPARVNSSDTMPCTKGRAPTFLSVALGNATADQKERHRYAKSRHSDIPRIDRLPAARQALTTAARQKNKMNHAHWMRASWSLTKAVPSVNGTIYKSRPSLNLVPTASAPASAGRSPKR